LVGEKEKNKYIKMPAGKMKIQTNALIRDAGALLENVSRSWLLLLVLRLAHSFRYRTKLSKGEAKGVTKDCWERSVRASMLSSPWQYISELFPFFRHQLCAFFALTEMVAC